MNFEELQQKDISKLRNLQPDGWSNIVPEFEFYVKTKIKTETETE